MCDLYNNLKSSFPVLELPLCMILDVSVDLHANDTHIPILMKLVAIYISWFFFFKQK